MTRDEARAIGRKTYSTGISCRRSHISERSTATGTCLACGRENRTMFLAKGPWHPARTMAHQNKERLYDPKSPCVRNHVAMREVSTNRCTECIREDSAGWFAEKQTDEDFRAKRKISASQWKRNNRDRVVQAAREWRAKNKEKCRKYSREHYKRNPDLFKRHAKAQRQRDPEKAKAWVADWKKKNPERWKRLMQVGKNMRRTRERGNGGSFTVADIEALHAKQNGACAVCPAINGLEIDHILPVILGGSSDPSNLQLLCQPCNRSKGATHPDEWRRSIRRRDLPYS